MRSYKNWRFCTISTNILKFNFRFSPCILTINHFYYPIYALNYIKLRDENLRCVSFKRQLKITPTCFGSCAIHHQGVLSCAWLKLVPSPLYRTHTHTHTADSKLCCQTPTQHMKNICEPLRVIFVKHSSVLPDDGLHTIRDMLEWFLIFF